MNQHLEMAQLDICLSLSQGCGSVSHLRRTEGRVCFQAYLPCWENPTPRGYWNERANCLLAVGWRLYLVSCRTAISNMATRFIKANKKENILAGKNSQFW